MEYADWPDFVKKRFALSKQSIGGSTVNAPRIEADSVVKWLYDVLTTLDAKASALMRLNGVLIAAAAFLLGLFGRQGTSVLATTPLDAKLIVASAMLSALSIIACLYVVRVSWSFLGRTILGASPDACDCSTEIHDLGKACEDRARIYTLAWHASRIASLLFIVEFILQTLHVFAVGGKAG